MPKWTPDGGWRVDKALVFAHALQESNFRASVVSPAGARGLMQVLPGTAKMMARQRGGIVDPAQLDNPSTNMEYGQRYLERLRDMSATGGLLPKVMAAYNAGPVPVRSEEHTSELQSLMRISYAVFCLKTKILKQIYLTVQYMNH